MRLAWLDNTKMVAMICVIIGHTGGLFANGIPERLMGLIVGFNMPLFVLLSGFVSLGTLYKIVDFKSLTEYFEKILWRMVVPAVALSAIDQAAKGLLFARKLWVLYFCIALLQWFVFRNPSIKEKLPKISGNLLLLSDFAIAVFLLVSSLWLNLFWFLAMLMKLQLTAACLSFILNLSQISQKTQVAVISLALWIGSYFCYDSWTFEMSIYSGIGLLFNHYNAMDRICKMNLLLGGILFVTGCALCRLFTINYGFYDSSLNALMINGMAHIYVIRIIVALLLSCAIIRWVYTCSNKYNWFSHAGSRSMAFYTIHALLLETVLSDFLLIIHIDYMWVCGFFMAFAITALTYGIILLCERTRLTRGLVLGDWK